jgi:hypothetical protein
MYQSADLSFSFSSLIVVASPARSLPGRLAAEVIAQLQTRRGTK